MRHWMPMARAPRDGRWIIALDRNDLDRRAIIRWDPERFPWDPEGLGDTKPWHMAACDCSYPDEAFTDWIHFPDCQHLMQAVSVVLEGDAT